jgi:hypothetical protein
MKPELVCLGEEEHHRRHKNPSKNVLAHNKVLLHFDFKTICIDGKKTTLPPAAIIKMYAFSKGGDKF